MAGIAACQRGVGRSSLTGYFLCQHSGTVIDGISCQDLDERTGRRIGDDTFSGANKIDSKSIERNSDANLA